MKIKWYGHACFRIEGGGVSIVTDPYTPEVAGLDPVEELADVVIMSSATDRFHSNAAMVPGDPKILNALEIAGRGSVEVNGVEFEAFPTMESLKHKESPDENAIYRFEVEGVSILHLGDLGNPLTNEQLDGLRGKVDILLALNRRTADHRARGPGSSHRRDCSAHRHPYALPDTQAQAGYFTPGSVHLPLPARRHNEGRICGSRVEPQYLAPNPPHLRPRPRRVNE